MYSSQAQAVGGQISSPPGAREQAARELALKDPALAVRVATLCYIQQQRKLSNRRLEDHLGIRHGALARFYAGDEAYLYLVDRVEEAIEALARRRERRMAHADTKARRELAQWRSSGTWRDANEVIALIETARGGYLHQHMYFEQMMQQEPFHGSAGDDDEEAT